MEVSGCSTEVSGHLMEVSGRSQEVDVGPTVVASKSGHVKDTILVKLANQIS